MDLLTFSSKLVGIIRAADWHALAARAPDTERGEWMGWRG